MQYLLLILTLLSFRSVAEEPRYLHEFDVTAIDFEHAWRGKDNYAQYEATLYGIGYSIWRNNFGLRVGYIKGKDLYTEGRFEHVTVKLKYVVSFEALYKYDITEQFRLAVGIGTHLIPVPQYYEGIDPDGHFANDADNDEGYILGLQWEPVEDVLVGWRFTHYSRITVAPYDEWTKGHSVSITYRF